MVEHILPQAEWEVQRPGLEPSSAIGRFVAALEAAGRIEYGTAGVLTVLGLDVRERLLVHDIEHNVLRRMIYLIDDEQEPYVEMPFYLDGHLAHYPIALRGTGISRRSRVKEQKQLVAFADAWGNSLLSQGWIERDVNLDVVQITDVISPEFALTNEERERLLHWIGRNDWEAVDSCWVQPAARCEHGSPSWFWELGLI